MVELIPLDEVAASATEIACEVAYTVYDCLYVATAIRQDCTLVTDDGRLIAALSKSRWSGIAQTLQTTKV